MINSNLKKRAIFLRSKGKTYSEINCVLRKKISKSTLSYWLQNINLSKSVKEKVRSKNIEHLNRIRLKALNTLKKSRNNYFRRIKADNFTLKKIINNKDICKIALSMLYLGEGSKRGGSLTFCNSNPYIIQLFLYLLRNCYNLDERKFRCTLQCRADQDIEQLQDYWSKITNLDKDLFNKPQVDKRSFGKKTLKDDYKGVCRLDYYSADIYNQISIIPRIIFKGH
ncbi:MAG: hypothetical protein WC666_03685 [Candidatus Paceibacterota bacterium]|jgi:hypothetical protein